MSTHGDLEGNKDLVRQFCDLFYNQKDYQAAEGMMEEGIMNHGLGAVGHGRKVMIENFGMEMQDNSPEFHLVLHRVVAEDDLVWTHGLVTRLPDGGKALRTDIWRVAHGKLAEHWTVQQPVEADVNVFELL